MRAGYTRFVTTWTERLYAFVNRWYAAPLRAGDGNSDLEISAVERELGDRLPEVLRDWYRLVGRRLRPAQDMPTRLSELVERRAWAELPGHVVVWNENQGCWRVEVPLGDAADPPARLKPDDDRWIGGATSEVLLSMLLSDTVMGPGFARSARSARGGRVSRRRARRAPRRAGHEHAAFDRPTGQSRARGMLVRRRRADRRVPPARMGLDGERRRGCGASTGPPASLISDTARDRSRTPSTTVAPAA